MYVCVCVCLYVYNVCILSGVYVMSWSVMHVCIYIMYVCMCIYVCVCVRIYIMFVFYQVCMSCHGVSCMFVFI